MANVTDMMSFCVPSAALNRQGSLGTPPLVRRKNDLMSCYRLLVVDLVHYEYMNHLCEVVGGLMPVPLSTSELSNVHDDFAEVLKQLHSGACQKDE